MAGPPRMTVIDGTDPTSGDGGAFPEGEGTQILTADVAEIVQNFVPHPDGGLETLRGPAPLTYTPAGGHPV
ncbi:MAG: hypothetical protein ABIK09_21195, partial [Pseudomonadota bacterium]